MKYISLLFFLLFSSSIYSQDDSSITLMDSLNEDMYSIELVVTTTLNKTPLSKSPESVTLISEEDIRNSAARNVDDLLKNIESVQTKRVTGLGEGIPSDINIRGIPGALASSRSMILIDGIPCNTGSTPFFILNEVSLSAIKQVEIIRGPFSSIYGSNAFGGVINIITKSGDSIPSFITSFETTWPFSVAYDKIKLHKSSKDAIYDGSSKAYYSSYGTFSGSSKNKKISYIIDGGYRTVGNYLMQDSAFVKGKDFTKYKPNVNFDYYDAKIFGKLTAELNKENSFIIQSRFFKSLLGFGLTKYVKPDSQNVDVGGNKFIVSGEYNWKPTDCYSLKFTTYFQNLLGEYWNEEPSSPSYIPSYWKSTANEYSAILLNKITAGYFNTLSLGLSFATNHFIFGKKHNYILNEPIASSDSTNQHSQNGAIFVQDEIKIKERFLTVPGVRFDYNSVFHGAISPKISMLYSINDMLRTRISVGKAYRAPSISEYAMPPLLIKPGFSLHSNPNLSPENLWAFDGAVMFQHKKDVNVSVGGFYNIMTDLIGQELTIPRDSLGNFMIDNAYISHSNINSAKSGGLELSAFVTPVNWLNIRGNLVFQNSKNESLEKEYLRYFTNSKDAQTFEYRLDYMPKLKGAFTLEFNKKIKNIKLFSSLTWLGVGERELFDLTLVNEDDIVIVPNENWGVHILPKPMYLAPYFTTDFSTGMEIKSLFTISFKVVNLFDEKYEESSGTEGTGRFATLKFTLSF